MATDSVFKSKKIYVIGGAVALFLVLVIIYFKNKDTETVCYKLPNTTDPSKFGPDYWAAFHDLAHRVPCPGCRGFAEKFMVFFHDTVNLKTGKPIQDEQNFKQFTQLYCDLNAGKDVFNLHSEAETATPVAETH